MTAAVLSRPKRRLYWAVAPSRMTKSIGWRGEARLTARPQRLSALGSASRTRRKVKASGAAGRR